MLQYFIPRAFMPKIETKLAGEIPGEHPFGMIERFGDGFDETIAVLAGIKNAHAVADKDGHGAGIQRTRDAVGHGLGERTFFAVAAILVFAPADL